MRSVLKAPAVTLVLILALPPACIAAADALGLQPPQTELWFGAWALGCVVVALLRAPGLSSLPKPNETVIDERANERLLRIFALLLAVAIDFVALLVAPFSPTATLLISAAVIGWIAFWSIPRFRRTRLTSSFVIRSSQQAVFTLVSDARNIRQWRHEYQSVEMLTPEPVGPGSRFRVRTRVPPDGAVFDGVEEIIDYEPTRRFTSWVSSGIHPNFDEFTFDVVEDGIRVTQRFDFEHSFTMAVCGTLFAQPSKNRLIMAGRRAGEIQLKQILEGGSSGSTGS
jgi:uncharacterized protein YndB with AHSA1/START domain